jgi:hypothetical protein
MYPSFACDGGTGERIDGGDYIRIHQNGDSTWEFYCIGQEECTVL